MKVTIVRPDNTVIVDGVARNIDCSALPAYLQAVQWDGEQAKGHLEFVQDGSGAFLLNQPILSFAQFDYLVQEHAQLLAAEQAEGEGGET